MRRPYKGTEELINDAIGREAAEHGDKSLKRDRNKIVCTKCDECVKYDRNDFEVTQAMVVTSFGVKS